MMQAYTVELEVELNQLKEENESLKKIVVIERGSSIYSFRKFVFLMTNQIFLLNLEQAETEEKRRKEVISERTLQPSWSATDRKYPETETGPVGNLTRGFCLTIYLSLYGSQVMKRKQSIRAAKAAVHLRAMRRTVSMAW